jgi:hypothetical protein
MFVPFSARNPADVPVARHSKTKRPLATTKGPGNSLALARTSILQKGGLAGQRKIFWIAECGMRIADSGKVQTFRPLHKLEEA